MSIRPTDMLVRILSAAARIRLKRNDAVLRRQPIDSDHIGLRGQRMPIR